MTTESKDKRIQTSEDHYSTVILDGLDELVTPIIEIIMTKPKYAANQLTTSMMYIHNILRRVFHFVEKKTHELIEDTDKRKKELDGLLDMLIAATNFLHLHHASEDDIFFPGVSNYLKEHIDENLISRLTNEHGDLITNMNIMEKLVVELKKTKSDDVTTKLQELEHSIMEIEKFLFPHLRLEETSITEDKIRHLTEKQNQELNDALAKHSKSAKEVTKVFPLLYYTLTDQERADWMEDGAPWILRKVVVPYLWKSSYSSFIGFLFNYPNQARSSLYNLPNQFEPHVL